MGPKSKKISDKDVGKMPSSKGNSGKKPKKPNEAATKGKQRQKEKQDVKDNNDDLIGMPSYESYEREDFDLQFPGVSKKKSKQLTTDKFGNTVSKSKLAEDKRIEEMRAAARARREAKGIGTENTEIKSSTESNKSDSNISFSNLTRKERKTLNQQAKCEAQVKELSLLDDRLSSFSLSIQSQRGIEKCDDDEDNWKTMSSMDIIVPCFSISAPGKKMLIDASLRIVCGRRYGVLGPNGCGKSTILRYLASRQFPIPEGIDVLLVEQEVPVSPEPLFQQVLNSDKHRLTLHQNLNDLEEQFEHQESLLGAQGNSLTPESPIWNEEDWERNLKRYTEIGAEWESCGASRAEAKVRKILTGLGFSASMQEKGSEQLSGGWRMRLSLASALFIEPKLLLLDEPTNHLDLNAVLWLDDYLCNQWPKNSSLLVVSHDADFLDSVCTDILHVDDYKISAYKGDFSFFEKMQGKALAKKEREYQLQLKTVKEFQKGNKLSLESAEKKAMKKLNVSFLREKPKEYRVNFVLNPSEDDTPAIDLLGISFSYPSQSTNENKFLFQNLRLKVDCHTRVAIVGPNGAGKSSLLRLLGGYLSPSSGEISRGHTLRIGWYDQHFDSLLPLDKTPVEYLMSTTSADKVEARKYLGMFGLDGTRHLIKIGQLSGGQKSRLILASISLKRPNILIMDEPTNHLDMESVEALIKAIKLFSGGVVLVSHDARLITATECDIWVVGDSLTGVREERQGFSKYRKDTLAAISRELELAERKASEKALRQKSRRDEKAKAIAKRCSRTASRDISNPVSVFNCDGNDAN